MPILIVAALPWEARTALASLRAVRSETRKGWTLTETTSAAAGPVAVLAAGMGPSRAATASEWAVARVRPAAILSIGCGGGLADDLRAGDVVVASAIHAEGGGRVRVAEELSARLRRAAEGAGITVRSGPIYSVASILHDAASKRAAQTASGALAVEMEAAAVGEAASRAGVPFAAARAVLDDAATEIVFARDLVAADGRLRVGALLAALVRGRGRTVRELARLAAARRACARSLVALQAAFFRADPRVANPGGVR